MTPINDTGLNDYIRETWLKSLEDVVKEETGDVAYIADFAANILRLCAPTPELTKFLNDRAENALAAEEGR